MNRAHEAKVIILSLVQGLARASSSTSSCGSWHTWEGRLFGTGETQCRWSGSVLQECLKVHCRPSMQTLTTRRHGELPSQPEKSRQDAPGHDARNEVAGDTCQI